MLCSVFRFGHQDVITAIDSLTRERAVTSGGRDGSVRIWKIIEESQLVFHGHAYVHDSAKFPVNRVYVIIIISEGKANKGNRFSFTSSVYFGMRLWHLPA